MASASTIFAIVGIVILILVGGIVGLLYFTNYGRNTSPSTTSITTSASSSSNTSTRTTTSTRSSSSSTLSTTSTSSTSPTTATTTKTITLSQNSTSTKTTTYALELLQAGSGSALNSSLKTNVPLTYFGGDGLGGDGGNYTFNYNDAGNLWYVQGDFAPGQAWLQANSTGFTLTDKTCFATGDPMANCGPYWEWNGDKRFVNGQLTGEENVSELSGVMYGIPTDLTVFSIYVHVPKYDFSTCIFNVSSTGCSYEGLGPALSGVWALDSSGTDQNRNNYSNSIAVSITEGKSGLFVASSTATIINGEYQASLSKNLKMNTPFFSNFTSDHKLTIATDRSSFLRIWVDKTLEYSNSTIPVNLGGNGLAANFYQFTSVNNMTLSTTWSNFSAYKSSTITVSGLQSGMSVTVNGADGFSQSALANSSGVAVIDVTTEPVALTVSVQLNGKTIVTYATPVEAGAQLKLVTT